MLPEIKQRTETVPVAGELVTIRSLSVFEVRRLKDNPDPQAADALCISLATGASEEEAQAWLESIPADDAVGLMAAIFQLTGLTEDARFPG